MFQKYFNFLIYLILFSLVLYVIWVLLKNYIPENYRYSNTVFVILFYTVLTGAFHFGALYSNQKSSTGFMRFYVAATTFKLLLLMGFMIVYALMNPEQSILFIIYFFTGYLLYTAFETTVIYKFMRA